MARKNTVSATANDVRAYFRENQSAIPEGAKHLFTDKNGNPARGRLPLSAVEVFNAKSGMTYTAGNVKTVTLDYKVTQPSGRKVRKSVALPVAEIRALAGTDKTRGPLSKADVEAASLAYAAALKG